MAEVAPYDLWICTQTGISRLDPEEEEQKFREALLAGGKTAEETEQIIQQAGFHDDPVESEAEQPAEEEDSDVE